LGVEGGKELLDNLVESSIGVLAKVTISGNLVQQGGGNLATSTASFGA